MVWRGVVFLYKDKGPAIIQRSMVRISEGFLDEIHNMPGRMRVLTVQNVVDKDIKTTQKLNLTDPLPEKIRRNILMRKYNSSI